MSSPLRKASMPGSSAISSRATFGRRPQIAKLGVVDDVRRAYRTGSSIAALARAHRVSRGEIRTAVADLLSGRPERPVASTANATTTWGEAERHALRQGLTVRRGQGYSLHVTAAPHVHHALLAAAAPLGADGAVSAARKAYRIYADRLTAAAILTDPAW
jgi:hypothetical protein